MDDLVEAFLLESRENLEQLDQDLLLLEDDPAAQEPVASAFRALHTIKGTCAFFGFPHLEALSHDAEHLLGSIRDGRCTPTPAVIDLLLRVSDRIVAILTVIETHSVEQDEPNEEMREQLRAAVAGEVPHPSGASANQEPEPETAALPSPDPDPDPDAGDDPAPTPVPEKSAPPGGQPSAVGNGGTLRVTVAVLDQLMSLVGELVLARNQMLQHREETLGPLAPVAERIDQITASLQETATQTRMQPVRNVFAKLPRTARDVAYVTGKDVQLLTEGEDTELDRTVLDAIRDPLTHLVRNAVDHGIEPPDRRRDAGKPPEGTVLLRGSQAGDQVIIEVIDDGGGIDPHRLIEKALERGVITGPQAASMGPREAFDLVFAAGFSTAAAVTNVSGRGVGMDVVRTNVEQIGGSVELTSELGAGSTVRITLPLTLAIIPALVVRCGGQHFALPQSGLREVLQLGPRAEARLERRHLDTVVRHRDQLLPVVSLGTLLGLGPGSATDEGTIVLLRSDDGTFGLVVDEVLETAEIVVKPLHPEIRRLGWYSGTTILGDGAVTLILDVAELARSCTPAEDTPATRTIARSEHLEEPDRRHFLVGNTGEEVLAIPLAEIDRIETIEAAQVEWADGAPILRSRDQLIHLLGYVAEPDDADADHLIAVVFQGSEPRTAICLPRVERVTQDVAHHADGLVVTGDRVAHLVGAAEAAGGRGW